MAENGKSIVGKNWSESAEIPRRRIKIFLVRHGSQMDYGQKDSPLNGIGCTQADTFAQELGERFKEDGEQHIIRILYSSRPRTRETAKRIEKVIGEMIIKGELPKVQIAQTKVFEPLQTADPLNREIWEERPVREAFTRWLHSDRTSLVEVKMLNIINRLDRTSSKLGMRCTPYTKTIF